MKKIGIIGWRGMVGQVLMERMRQENDFLKAKYFLFSTSQAGQKNTQYADAAELILNANTVDELKDMDILVSCQGGDYSKDIHPKLRNAGWEGYWIDAASAFRMNDNACLILDPVNFSNIDKEINAGTKDFIGANCTVSLMLMALGGLFKEDLIEWVSSMTYQAASGAGAQNMIELLKQSAVIGDEYKRNPALSALEYEKKLSATINSKDFPIDNFGHPLALNLLPWIDTKVESGQSREEWKGQVEASKILGRNVLVDGTCVRVANLRCHSQGFTIKLKKDVELKTLESIIGTHNDWVEFVENEKETTLKKLTPAYVSGTLAIPVGRLRKMTLGNQFLNAFSVGDQLLWGAAEPLRRMVNILLNT